MMGITVKAEALYTGKILGVEHSEQVSIKV